MLNVYFCLASDGFSIFILLCFFKIENKVLINIWQMHFFLFADFFKPLLPAAIQKVFSMCLIASCKK